MIFALVLSKPLPLEKTLPGFVVRLGPPRFGTNTDNNRGNVGTAKNKKNVGARHARMQRAKRKKEKLIRLDDLIPKQDVTGGRRLLFGVTGTTQPNKKGK